MVENFDTEGLDRLGPNLMLAMVETDDAILNVTAAIIAEVMLGVASDPTTDNFANMLEGFDAYIETCTNLGAIPGQ